MKVAVAFEKPVYKDQTVGANKGKLIAPGDTVTVAIRNAAAAETPLNLVATDVLYSATTIQFDTPLAAEPNLTLRAEDITRVHAKHQYQCPVAGNYRAVLTEAGGGAAIAGVTSVTLGGIARAIGVSEAAAAPGLTPEFIAAFQSKLNTILNGHGYANLTKGAQAAGSQTLTIDITGATLVPTTIGVTPGLTVTTPFAVFP